MIMYITVQKFGVGKKVSNAYQDIYLVNNFFYNSKQLFSVFMYHKM